MSKSDLARICTIIDYRRMITSDADDTLMYNNSYCINAIMNLTK